MNSKKALLSFLILLVAPTKAHAAAPNTLTVVGLGTQSCGDWITYRSSANNLSAFELESWVDGFMTAWEDYKAEGSNANATITTDQNGVYVWIDNYCRENPTATLYGAVKNFLTENANAIQIQK